MVQTLRHTNVCIQEQTSQQLDNKNKSTFSNLNAKLYSINNTLCYNVGKIIVVLVKIKKACEH